MDMVYEYFILFRLQHGSYEGPSFITLRFPYIVMELNASVHESEAIKVKPPGGPHAFFMTFLQYLYQK